MSTPLEQPYLDLVTRVLEHGVSREDRTGVGTLSVFGHQMRFDLGGGAIPLLTTKRVWFRGIVEELLWMLRGSTDANELAARGVHIWAGNSTREFLDARGLRALRVGDIGAGYGFQWRHWGAEYRGCDADYAGAGIDQIASIIEQLKREPTSRRIILSAWNVSALAEMALPPCHMTAQFYVAHGKLSCQLYQRSGDVGLGVPFNMASYALLTHILCAEVGLEPGELIHTLGDAHIYQNHAVGLREQLTREPRPPPRVEIRYSSLEALTASDIKLVGYSPHPKIDLEMAV